MPSERVVLLNHYFVSLPLTCLPRIKLDKSDAGITSYRMLLHSILRGCSVEWDSGQKVKGDRLKCFPNQTVLRQFRRQPHSF